MADKAAEQKEKGYLRKVRDFYFAPGPESFLTVFFLCVYGYFVLYYSDDMLLALKYLVYTIGSGTALLSIAHLFWGTLFLISLAFPFIASLYAIFVLYEAWHEKRDWDDHFRIVMTILLIVVSALLIITLDNLSHSIAHQDAIRGFIQDENLVGRI